MRLLREGDVSWVVGFEEMEIYSTPSRRVGGGLLIKCFIGVCTNGLPSCYGGICTKALLNRVVGGVSTKFCGWMDVCMCASMNGRVGVWVDVYLVGTGCAEELSTVDGRNIVPLSVGEYVPSRSQFNIGSCDVVCWLGGANGPNLAPPHLLPNIESGGKGPGKGKGKGKGTSPKGKGKGN